MATQTAAFTVVFPDWYDERAEYEVPMKGYLEGVVVRMADGARYGLCFYDPVRLQQDVERGAEFGQTYVAEPGLVILPEVTTQAIQKVVPNLLRDGFFSHLKPLA